MRMLKIGGLDEEHGGDAFRGLDTLDMGDHTGGIELAELQAGTADSSYEENPLARVLRPSIRRSIRRPSVRGVQDKPDLVAQLTDLATLRNSGALDDAEYQDAKQILLKTAASS
eukprot:gnl/TRDRNA2_/TRDRNA2_166488_c3_seq1.p1 gnl/TRDRNA2_/TRDRNA2_166488_c3~~gnl/TRDRNA2_/TRDRNA2_166488_c3_seq1.p1  ORF type:complete len:114 (+),score=22.32 gnl/TRDRNA2_/TRDRNA2_166488_c3_seq1:2-343(+)